MNEVGKYCENGKKIDEINKSRKGMHETVNSLTVSMAKFETTLTYIKDKVDSIDKNLEKKVDWKALLLLATIAIASFGFLYNKMSDIESYLSQYNIVVHD